MLSKPHGLKANKTIFVAIDHSWQRKDASELDLGLWAQAKVVSSQ